jgi:hypothetical protein
VVRALTLYRPWDWCICPNDPSFQHPKRLENRTWKPPSSTMSQRIALHAGQVYDVGALGFIAARCNGLLIPNKVERPAGRIVCTAVVLGWFHEDGRSEGLLAEEVERWRQDRWFMGPWAWVLDEVLPCTIEVPCPRGHLGLWTLPQETERAVLLATSRVH